MPIVLFAIDQLERTEDMNQNRSTETKKLTPITEKQKEAREIVPLDKEEDATGNGNTIFGGIQKWLWGFVVSLPLTRGLETITKAAELGVSQPPLLLVTPTSLPRRLMGQIRMLPPFPKIVETGGTPPLSGLHWVLQPARDTLACPHQSNYVDQGKREQRRI